jgi:hypothetical protein
VAERVIRKRIRRSGTWGELLSDVNVVIASNVGGELPSAPPLKKDEAEAEQATDETRAHGKEVRDERE